MTLSISLWRKGRSREHKSRLGGNRESKSNNILSKQEVPILSLKSSQMREALAVCSKTKFPD
jgi:hypothetical protein